ncbi:MAG: 6-carboxytetrahydropterin synthase [Methylococcales symbiont of Hymedesmia sp. n. MRB-2018]|nr:MAG: 6-carboxytetrahydropterin synthase [Methylococcales symbiont of Hymedesmia sp. n. MRB-2018]KAF3983395.1 MAG: 6-carboxytetrahydropterin synthase [Methylococcales symbiont of Hymedesmia sp. n. MRB-2018]
MHTITKEVYFCYGHRLMNHSGKCRNLHGHSVKASISITQEHLNEQSMVYDFSDIKNHAELYINQHLDHNFIVHKDDPIILALKAQNERFMAIDEHPTAEVLSKMIYQHLKQEGLNVDQVVLWETASANASYRESHK